MPPFNKAMGPLYEAEGEEVNTQINLSPGEEMFPDLKLVKPGSQRAPDLGHCREKSNFKTSTRASIKET